MQQPLEQYVAAGQLMLALHTVSPTGQVAVLQFAGSVLGSWPGHRMQLVPPQVPLPHDVLFVQVLQTAGLEIVLASQFGEVAGLMSMS